MHNLPVPKLGDVTAITIATPDLERSLQFYNKLGFRELYRFDFPFPFIKITDDALLIMLRMDDTPYIALTYYVKELEGVVAELEQAGIVFESKPRDFDMIKRYHIKSPDGFTISLVTYVDGFYNPKGRTMLTMPKEDFGNPGKYTNKICGIFWEFAHYVSDLEASLLFWEKLGFVILSRNSAPYPWAIISDGLAVVGLHQEQDTLGPSITFFASDMKKKINDLKTAGLTGFIEIGVKGHVILKTPENHHINLFGLST